MKCNDGDTKNMEYTEARRKNTRTMQYISLAICVMSFIACSVLTAYFSLRIDKALFYINGIPIYGSFLTGIFSQLQLLITIIIILNPVKYSKVFAIGLNTAAALVASGAFFIDNNIDAFLGIIMPVSSIIVSLIISNYSSRFKMQMTKMTRFNSIMKDNDEMLYQIAYYDALTGLPNRRMILEKIKYLADMGLEENKSFYFVLIDLDNFKKINDAMGYGAGDEILVQIARKWQELIHPGDILGRIGGDDFSLIINRGMDRDELTEYLEVFRKALANVITADRKEFYIRASFGITVFPDDGTDINDLLKKADIALFKTKSMGKNGIMFFNSDIHDEIMRKIHIENGLMSAIENNELYLVFQPIFKCTGEVRGYEALARWRNPELGQVNPAQFIPVAEENGLIIDIGRWILRKVVRDFMNLKKTYNITPVVSVNISVVQMIEASFAGMVREILDETGFDGRCLEFEITESVFISYPDQIIRVINELKKLGIRIALDDFGTGYASLSYLQILPIDTLKIDKTFIDKISAHDNKQIVGSIISMAHELGMEVIAEGVERKEQLDYLAEQGCDYIQGFLLSKPVDKEKMTEQLSSIPI